MNMVARSTRVIREETIDGMYRVICFRERTISHGGLTWWWKMIGADDGWNGPHGTEAEAKENLRLFREGS